MRSGSRFGAAATAASPNQVSVDLLVEVEDRLLHRWRIPATTCAPPFEQAPAAVCSSPDAIAVRASGTGKRLLTMQAWKR